MGVIRRKINLFTALFAVKSGLIRRVHVINIDLLPYGDFAVNPVNFIHSSIS
jgi:hypothetical protein